MKIGAGCRRIKPLDAAVSSERMSVVYKRAIEVDVHTK
jgi:hypothetical protein